MKLLPVLLSSVSFICLRDAATVTSCLLSGHVCSSDSVMFSERSRLTVLLVLAAAHTMQRFSQENTGAAVGKLSLDSTSPTAG